MACRAAIAAIRQVPGAEAATDELLAAWGKAYGFPAHLLIGKENDPYAQAEAAA